MSKQEKLSLPVVRERVERIVFKAGGWLTIANKMETTPEALKRKISSSTYAHQLLSILEREYAA